MLMRDPLSTDLTEALINEVIHGDRELLVFLIDHPLHVAPFITADTVTGLGWNGNQLHWLDWNFKPVGAKVCDQINDTTVRKIVDKLSLVVLQVCNASQRTTQVFPQDHIKTQADANKLFRFMGRHHSTYNVRN